MSLEAAKLQHTALPSEPTKHVNGRMWQPAQSGNPNGRPVGSRSAFSAGFLKDLAEVWSQEGRETMVKTAKTNPAVFFATCGSADRARGQAHYRAVATWQLSMEDWQGRSLILER
jgi:hypothetical protein